MAETLQKRKGKEPIENFQVIINGSKFFLRLLLADFLDPTFKPSVKCYMCGIGAVILIGFTFFTVFAYEIETGLKSMSIFGIVLQGIVKNIEAIGQRKKINGSIDFVKKFYNGIKFGPAREIAERCSIKLTKLYKVAIAYYTFTVIVVIAMPLPVYLLLGERTYIVYNFVPGVDENSTGGYIFLYIYHAYMISTGYVGTSGTDVLLMFIMGSMWPITKVMQVGIDELNAELNKHKKSTPLTRLQLRNVVLMHREFYE